MKLVAEKTRTFSDSTDFSEITQTCVCLLAMYMKTENNCISMHDLIMFNFVCILGKGLRKKLNYSIDKGITK